MPCLQMSRLRRRSPHGKTNRSLYEMVQEERYKYPESLVQDECRTVTIVELEKPPGAGFGLTISGGIDKDGRIRVSNMRPGGIAQRSDLLQVGDYVTSVSGVQTANLRHDEVIGLLKSAGNRVKIELEHEVPPIPAANGASAISKVLELRLVREEISFGFTIRGGMKPLHSKSRPLTVTHIRPGGPADREGTLKIGDRIVAVNSTPLNHITHNDALMIFKQLLGEACFKVEYDVSVMEAVKNATGPLLVEVSKTPGAHLGITLNSAVNNGKLAVMIDAIKPGSIADRCGALHVGDEILTIDGSSTGHMTVPEATQLLGSASEQVKLEIMPLSQMTPRLTYHNEPKLMMNDSLSQSMGLSPYNFSSTGNIHGYHSVPGYGGGLANRSMSGNLMSSNLMMNPRAITQTPSMPGSSTLSRKMKNKKSGSQLSLASTINGLNAAQLSHIASMQVVLYSRMGDFGIMLQNSIFATEAIGSPAVIANIEPSGKADRCGVLQPGDRILAINGRYTEEMTSDEASHLLRESGQQCVLDVEFDIAETVVPSSGTFNVKLPVGDAGLGLTLSSARGRTLGEGLVISQVKKGSIAHRSGTMEPGDRLLAIDDIHVDTFTVDEALHLLRQADDVVKLRVKKDEAYSDEPSVSGAISYSVELIRHGGPLGITISGTEERFDPVVISGLTEGGLAERTGAIHLGDRLLAINSVSLRGKTLSEAIRLLQNAGDVVILKVSKQERPRRGSLNELGLTERHEREGRRSRAMSPARSGTLPSMFRSYSTDQPGTPIIPDDRIRYDNWEESGLDTGYQSHYTHHSRSISPATARSRSRASSMSPSRSRQSRRHASVSPSRRSNRGRHSRRPSYSGSPYDMSDEEMDHPMLSVDYRDQYRQTDGYREYDDSYPPPSRRNGRLPPDDRMDRPVEYFQDNGYNNYPMAGANGLSVNQGSMNLNGGSSSHDIPTNGSFGRYVKRRDRSVDRRDRSLPGSKATTPPPVLDDHGKPSYSDPESRDISTPPAVGFESLTSRMDSISMQSFEEGKQLSDSDGAPAPVELLRVALYKDSDVEDFGFSVSDGITEKGVFVNTIRPGGPAAKQGSVRPFDRVLQVNQTRTRNFDCCMVVPLIAASGNKLDLVLSRNPIAQLKLGPPSDGLGASPSRPSENGHQDSNDSSQVSM
ncbi:glutamate receptor-interacting protein 2-like isoform X3 [Apostichopus japonicus]|uniref:glutamate receptor-interacting protein 2-like isoform X3 n=1 Tax=Stichopus japonicus TaxID=307972 RepID=UPI003AB8AB3E